MDTSNKMHWNINGCYKMTFYPLTFEWILLLIENRDMLSRIDIDPGSINKPLTFLIQM
jgi:hypothetical protein